MRLRFTAEGALRLTIWIISVSAMAALLALIFEKILLCVILALVAVLGCLAAILIVRNEYNQTL